MASNLKGSFCVIEGINGSGKTTLINSIYEKWKYSNSKTHLILSKEPSNSKHGKKFSKLLYRKYRDTTMLVNLSIEDRLYNSLNVVLPAYNKGHTILQSRSFYSSAVHQGIGNFNPSHIVLMNKQKRYIMTPHKLFFLKINPEIALKRIIERDKKTSRTIEELEKFQNKYLEILPKETFFLNSEDSIAKLTEKVYKILF